MSRPPTFALLAVALAVAAAPAARAESTGSLQKQLQDLKAQVEALQKKIDAQQASEAERAQAEQDLKHTTVKVEALEEERETTGFKGLKFSGYMDPSFILNKDRHRAGFQFLDNVNANGDGYNYDNSYFGSAALDILKEMEGGTKWHLTLSPNRGVGAVFNHDSPIAEASVDVPLQGDYHLLAGQLPDWSGYEYLPPTQNKLVTHNLLFDFTLPTAYTGAGLSLMPSSGWQFKSMLGNMNSARVKDGQRTPMLALRGDLSLDEYNGVGFATVLGRAANYRVDGTGDQTSQVALFEVDGYRTRGDWNFGGQLSWGTQKKAAITAAADGSLQDAVWWGASGLVSYKFTPRIEGILRADWLDDSRHGGGLLGYVAADSRNGIGPDATDPGRGANRQAVSLGLNYTFNAHTLFKSELRLDRADRAVFLNTDDGSFSKTNTLVGGSVVVSF